MQPWRVRRRRVDEEHATLRRLPAHSGVRRRAALQPWTHNAHRYASCHLRTTTLAVAPHNRSSRATSRQDETSDVRACMACAQVVVAALGVRVRVHEQRGHLNSRFLPVLCRCAAHGSQFTVCRHSNETKEPTNTSDRTCTVCFDGYTWTGIYTCTANGEAVSAADVKLSGGKFEGHNNVSG